MSGWAGSTDWAQVWERLGQLARLEAGWADGSGAAPDPRLLAAARTGLIALAAAGAPPPLVAPAEDGWLELCWHGPGQMLTVTVDGDPLSVLHITVDPLRGRLHDCPRGWGQVAATVRRLTADAAPTRRRPPHRLRWGGRSAVRLSRARGQPWCR